MENLLNIKTIISSRKSEQNCKRMKKIGKYITLLLIIKDKKIKMNTVMEYNIF